MSMIAILAAVPVPPSIPTLAQRGDWVELVIYAIGTVIVVGGWIANQLRQMREEQQRRRKIAGLEAGRQAGRSDIPDKSGVQPMPTQDELARRRRQQLAELARRRGEGDEAAPREPAGLSPHEASQRQRAREAYERRAETLRRQRAEAERQAERDSEGATRQQRDLRQRRERAQQTQRQRDLQRRMQDRTRISPPPPAAPPIPTAPTPVLKRVAATAPTPAAPARAAAFAAAIGPLNVNALRRAIILKEVLDRPVALREPIDMARY